MLGIEDLCWVLVLAFWGNKSVSGFAALQILALVFLGCPPLLFLPQYYVVESRQKVSKQKSRNK